MVEFGRFGILADGRPIKLGRRAFDMLMALIEASGVVVSKDELLSRVRQGRIVDQDRQLGTIAALRKGFSADRELIPMVAHAVTSSPARFARSPGTGGQVPAEAPADEPSRRAR
jgi:DNA-binding response OmpR family regulator